jgi:acetyl esterase/lipase
MDASRLHPELRSFRFIPNPPVGRTWFLSLSRKLIRFAPAARSTAAVAIERIAFAPGVGVRVYTPSERAVDGAVLWIHGGGMVLGFAAQDDRHCLDVATRLGVLVVSVEYRLAPEHPFPTPVDDCHRAWRWLQENAAGRGVDPGHVVVGGQSAGGGLAASLVQRLHDEGGPQPAGQWLFCPMLDDRTAANRDLDRVRHFLWSNRSNRAGWTAYLGTAPGAPSVPDYAVPARRESLAGLPPAWIGTGDVELFYDEDRAYAAALTAAGVECELDVVPGAPHAFERISAKAPVARAYLQRSLAWLRGRLAAAA